MNPSREQIAKEAGIILLSQISLCSDLFAEDVFCEVSGCENPVDTSISSSHLQSDNMFVSDAVSASNHTYRDYSSTLERAIPACKSGGVQVLFPVMLYEMLEQIELSGPEQFQDVVAWQPHGRCFKVRDIYKFENFVLPCFFQHQKKFASFRRQLNLYGFKRLCRPGPDNGAYYHQQFLRARPYLCRSMARGSSLQGSSDTRVASNPEHEPRFSKMDPLPALSLNAVVAVGRNSCRDEEFNGEHVNDEQLPIPSVPLRSLPTAPSLEDTALVRNLHARIQDESQALVLGTAASLTNLLLPFRTASGLQRRSDPLANSVTSLMNISEPYSSASSYPCNNSIGYLRGGHPPYSNSFFSNTSGFFQPNGMRRSNTNQSFSLVSPFSSHIALLGKGQNDDTCEGVNNQFYVGNNPTGNSIWPTLQVQDLAHRHALSFDRLENGV
jgi:hypothetical protein